MQPTQHPLGEWQDAQWPLRPCPLHEPWWRRWMWWRRDGALNITGPFLKQISQQGRDLNSLNLDDPLTVHLHAWPINNRHAWLSVTINQGVARLEVQTRLPWSALPLDLPLLASSSPTLDDAHFEPLWHILHTTQLLRGHELPAIKPGLYPNTPRSLNLAKPPARNATTHIKPDPTKVIQGKKGREQLKAQARSLSPDTYIQCAYCGRYTLVKAKNIVRHFDQQHNSSRW